jgi:glucose-1-phosphate thymidylyltransferase
MAERQPLGVLLTGGLGTRLRPVTPDLPKSLVPLLNRPLVAYGLDLLAGMGLRDLVVVVGGGDSRTGPAALEYAPPGTTVGLAEQPVPKGPGDAVACVGETLADRTVVVLAVDTILVGGDARAQLNAFRASNAVAWLPLAHTDRPREMGIALLDGDRIVELEEKPHQPKSDLACVGLWLLSPAAVERVRTNPLVNAKGESDLTGTIATMLAEGSHVGGREFTGQWLDGGSLSGLLKAQSALLRDAPPVALATANTTGSELVMSESSVQVVDSELHAPVMLGKDAHIEDCVLGPDVVVGAGAHLRGMRLQRALVIPGAHAEGGEHQDVVITAKGELASAQ